jgi:hypothetical protein
MDFRAFWEKFRKTVYFRMFYLVLVSALAAFLLTLGAACLFLLIVPVLMLLVPYWFGERSVKNHAINGLFVIPLVALFYAMILTPALLSQGQTPQEVNCPTDFAGSSPRCLSATSPILQLADGIVTPLGGGPSTRFNFTVNMTSTDPQANNMSVRVQVLDFEDLNFIPRYFRLARDPIGDGDLANGEDFYVETTLHPVFHYGFNFQVLNATDAVVAQTFGNGGPVNASYGTVFGYTFYQAIIGMIVIGFGFYVILVVYWWTRKAREMRGGKMEQPQRKRAEGGGEFTCTNCGADVAETDTKCPTCGAEFEPEAKGEPAEGKA